MQPASRAAATLMRARLVSDAPSPAVVRSVLRSIPREDRDRWLDLLLDTEDLPDDGPDLPRGCVPYLPCPVATVLDAIEAADVGSSDVFVDVGSGIGRPSFLTHLLTGAGCIGLEVQPSLAEFATGRADRLNLGRTRFIQGDAVESIRLVTSGTVFFLYCPFSGDRLERFLDGLEAIARARPIRVCCVDMAPLQRPWLVRLASTSSQLDVYRSSNLDPR